MSRPGYRVEILHGVNLDQLGHRDPVIYGSLTLPELEALIEREGRALDIEVSCFQSNHEGAFVERLHALRGNVDGAIINPGAWTHYSWAIRDALEIAAVPAIELHLSDPLSREQWRRQSVIGELCFASVRGEGPDGYRHALELMRGRLEGSDA